MSLQCQHMTATPHKVMDVRDLHLESPMTHVTTKIPPRYDGRTSWFAYEEAVDDWVDVTELLRKSTFQH